MQHWARLGVTGYQYPGYITGNTNVVYRISVSTWNILESRVLVIGCQYPAYNILEARKLGIGSQYPDGDTGKEMKRYIDRTSMSK